MSNINLFRYNLQCIGNNQNLKILTAEKGRLRLCNQDETADTNKVMQIFQATVRRARLSNPKHRIWIQIAEGNQFVSPNYILNKHLSEDEQLPLEEEKESPVILVFGNTKIQTYKEALAASSSIFRAMLMRSFKESRQKEVEIQLPIEVDLQVLELFIHALESAQLPKNLDINIYAKLTILFEYFQAETLLDAACKKIVSFNQDTVDFITFLANPVHALTKHVIKHLSTNAAQALLTAVQALSTEDLAAAGFSATQNAHGATVSIQSQNGSYSIQQLVLSLVNEKRLRVTNALLEYLDSHTKLLQSANLECYNGDLNTFFKFCPNILSLRLPFSVQGDDILKHLPLSLQILNISGCIQLEADTLKHLPLNLQILNISGCTQLEADALKHLPLNLHSLYMSGCSRLEVDALRHLPPNLQILNIMFCKQLQTDALRHLPSSLQALDISGCTQLEADALKRLPLNLQTLNISYCTQLEANALRHLPLNLQTLNMSYCTQLRRDSIPQKLLRTKQEISPDFLIF